MRLQDLAANERPQERLERFGASALSDTELLAMLLRSGSKDLDVMGISVQLIAEAGSLAGLLSWSVEDFKRMKGIGRVKALQLITIMEVARRILSQSEGVEPHLGNPEQVFQYMAPIVAGLQVEKFWILCLNAKNKLIKRVEVSSGLANASLVHPREVFREAIRVGAVSILAVHNHPSGDPTPSDADIQITENLRQSGYVLGIKLCDHIIISQGGRLYTSFVEEDMLK